MYWLRVAFAILALSVSADAEEACPRSYAHSSIVEDCKTANLPYNFKLVRPTAPRSETGVAWAAGPSHEPSKGTVMVFDFDSSAIQLVTPLGFELGSVQGSLLEFVPEGETVENWSQIFTLSIYNHSKVDPSAVREKAKKAFYRNCSKKLAVPDDPPIAKKNNQVFVEWIEACAALSAGPSKGKAEVGLFRYIQGRKTDFAVSIIFRSVPTAKGTESW